MNTEQTQSVISLIEQLGNVNSHKFEVLDSDYSLGNGRGREMFKRNIALFEQAQREQLLESMPAFFMPKDSAGDAFIVNTLSSLQNAIDKDAPGELEYYLLELNSYIYQSGLIHLLATSPFIHDVHQLASLKVQVEGVMHRLENDRSVQQVLIQEVRTTKDQLDLFTNEKEAEFSSLSSNLQSAEATKRQIDTLLDEARTLHNKINVIYTEGGLKRESVIAEFNTFKEDTEQLLSDVRSEKDKQAALIQKHESIQADAAELTLKASGIKVELERLLNPAIAQNLLETFKKRQEKLFQTKIVWAGVSGVMAIAFAIYAWYLFKYEHTDLSLRGVLITAVKLLPVLTLAYFATRQYAIERSLQEEYAFRESIATSLMSYAEQIKGSPEEKDKLIKETVEKLYRSPIKTRAKGMELPWGRKRMVKEVTELVKEINNLKSPNG